MRTLVSFWHLAKWFFAVLYEDHVWAESPLFAALLSASAMLKGMGSFLKLSFVTRPFWGPYFDLPGFGFGEKIVLLFPGEKKKMLWVYIKTLFHFALLLNAKSVLTHYISSPIAWPVAYNPRVITACYTPWDKRGQNFCDFSSWTSCSHVYVVFIPIYL